MKIASGDTQQYFAWLVLTLDKTNLEIVDVLERLKELQRSLPPSLVNSGSIVDASSMSVEGSVDVSLASIGDLGQGAKWYSEVANDSLMAASHALRNAAKEPPAENLPARTTLIKKALTLLATLNKTIANNLDDSEMRIALDASLTALRPEHAANMRVYKSVIKTTHRIQELLTLSPGAAATATAVTANPVASWTVGGKHES